MIRTRLAALPVCLALLLCALARDARAVELQPVVILLSWDGTRYDYPARVETQALARMARDGAHATRLTPVYPSSTFPNHVSLATGTYPDRHGIIENGFTDRAGRRFQYSNDASWLEAEPLWVAAERQNVRAAVFFWVGSESAWRGRAATYRKTPFDDSIGEAEKVDQILAWLDLPAAERPGLIMSWWHGCDKVGHDLGPNAPEIATQLLAQDRELARLFAGLDARAAWSHTTVIVTSDHGMAEITGAIDPQPALDAAGIHARIEYSGGEAQLYLADPAQTEAALAVLAGVDGLTAWANDASHSAKRNVFVGRSGDITLSVDPPNVLRRATPQARFYSFLGWLRGKSYGAHGHDPERPELGAIFYALGRGVPAGAKLGEVRSIDVAPTAAALLGIDPPQSSEGRALFAPPPQTDSNKDAKP